jgi:hypothetical protein
MKRIQSTMVATESEGILALPEEIFAVVHHCFREQVIRVSDFLHWYASCQCLWREYLAMEDTEVIEFYEKKKVQNRLLLLKTLRVVYKNNMLQFMQFKHIVKNCARIVACIIMVAKSDIFDLDLPCTIQNGFFVQTCGLFDGISFTNTSTYVESGNDGGTIADDSMVVLCGVAERILARYGWRLSLIFKRGDNISATIDLPCTRPWSIPSRSDVYIR